jgi:hypothetical protein
MKKKKKKMMMMGMITNHGSGGRLALLEIQALHLPMFSKKVSMLLYSSKND